MSRPSSMAEVISGLNPHAPSFIPLPKQPFFSDCSGLTSPIGPYYTAPPPPPPQNPNHYHYYSSFCYSYFHLFQTTTPTPCTYYFNNPFTTHQPTSNFNNFAQQSSDQPPKDPEADQSHAVDHHQTQGGGYRNQKPAATAVSISPRPPRLTKASANPTNSSPKGCYRKYACRNYKPEKKAEALVKKYKGFNCGTRSTRASAALSDGNNSFAESENHHRVEYYSSGTDWLVPKFKSLKNKFGYLDVLHVERDSRNTTVMIRNIPNKYTRDMLMDLLDNHCAEENRKSEGADNSDVLSAFDFLYLPIDFHTGMNKGYAFVNFTNPEAVWKFYQAADGQSWDIFQSLKIRQIAYAKIQGIKELMSHFETMGFPCESEDVLPVCFDPARNGSRAPVQQEAVGRPIYRSSTRPRCQTRQED